MNKNIFYEAHVFTWQIYKLYSNEWKQNLNLMIKAVFSPARGKAKRIEF